MPGLGRNFCGPQDLDQADLAFACDPQARPQHFDISEVLAYQGFELRVVDRNKVTNCGLYVSQQGSLNGAWFDEDCLAIDSRWAAVFG